MYVPAMAWQQFSNDSLTLPKKYISCQKVAALVITGNYVAMWMQHCRSVAIKLLVLVIAGNCVAMRMHHCHSVAGVGHYWQLSGNVKHHCHSVAMKLLALAIAGNNMGMT